MADFDSVQLDKVVAVVDVECLGLTPGSAVMEVGLVVGKLREIMGFGLLKTNPIPDDLLVSNATVVSGCGLSFGPDCIETDATGSSGYVSLYEFRFPNIGLQLVKGLRIEPESLSWWQEPKQKPHFETMMAAKYDAGTMDELLSVLKTADYLVCRGTDFDPPVLREFFKAFGKELPNGFWTWVDLRSVESTMKMLGLKVEREKNPNAHSALADAVNAARQYGQIMAKLVMPGLLLSLVPITATTDTK